MADVDFSNPQWLKRRSSRCIGGKSFDRPVITEKSSFAATELNQYTFVVDPDANKITG